MHACSQSGSQVAVRGPGAIEDLRTPDGISPNRSPRAEDKDARALANRGWFSCAFWLLLLLLFSLRFD